MSVFETKIFQLNGFIALNLQFLTKDDIFQIKGVSALKRQFDM